MARIGRQDFEIAAFPRQNFLEGLFAREMGRRGVDDLPVLHPDFAVQRPLGDVENGGTSGQAFQLDQVHQALALHAAKSSLVARFAVQERLDAILEQV